MTYTPGPWRYEAHTKTIRSEPSNYWLATMDSFDGAVDNESNARLIAAAPALVEALEAVIDGLPTLGRAVLLMNGENPKHTQFLRETYGGWCDKTIAQVIAALKQAKGECHDRHADRTERY